MSSVNHDDFAHLKIPLHDILSATNNFSNQYICGKGAFVTYYKVQLLWSGELINIYAGRLNKEWVDGDQQFWLEVSMLSSLKHKNLESLVGFCDDNDEKVIIYKDETRGSLYNYLRDPMLLTWVRRLEICVGIAQALSYIHYDESRDFSVIHRNIDSYSILLNDDWEPQLGDFKHSMKIKASERHNSFYTDEVWSTDGYTDPTYIETKSASHKSDIYSFGIVMFELLCGREAVIEDDQDNKYLASVAVTHYREKKLNEIIDWELWNQMDSQSFNILAEIAYDCLNEERLKRPDIDEIVSRLVKALELARENMPIMSSRIHDLAHLKIPLDSILSATNNFDDKNVVLRGEYEARYYGQLSWFGELIKITARRLFYTDRDEVFWTEVSMLSSLKHQNLVSLVGFCDENGEKIIITRHETKGSLRNYLSDATLLTWVQRLKISVGLAHALSYIHFDEPRDFSVIHRGIASHTILLDDNCEPKLSDFEKSARIKASLRHHSFLTNELWTWNGYTDPTYENTKLVNHKTDVYSFGIVLFELLCSRRAIIEGDRDNQYLAPLAILHYKEKKLNEIIDWDMWKHMDPQSFNVFTETAYGCLNEERSQCPSIDEIVTRLENALELQLEHQNAISLLKDDLAHLKIPLEKILSATNNFGTCGINYEEYNGQLSWSDDLIDIYARRLEEFEKEWDFWMEVSLLSSLKHKNVVSFVGFCDENGEKIIITRREKRGRLNDYLSLYNYLSVPMSLPWVRRLEICVGIAQALSYIHYDESRNFSVIHRNINSRSIQLNDHWEPKLSNFEYSMKIQTSQRHNSFNTNTLKYAAGYGDPTYFKTKNVNHKSDMYSFGIVLIELLCGVRDLRHTYYFAPQFITHYREKNLDNLIAQDLRVQMDLHSFNMFAEIAYECLNEERSRCPNIDDIVPRLEKALELARENRPVTCILDIQHP